MTAETTVKDENIVWHQHSVDKQFRAELKKQKPAVLWFTGLSGAGKSTVAGRWKIALQHWVTTPIYWMVTMYDMVCVAI